MYNFMPALQASLTSQMVYWWPVNSVIMPTLHHKSPPHLPPPQSCIGFMGITVLPPSLSLLSPQAVSMDVSQPAPLQPSWQTQCHPFRSKVHLPLPLHNPGQPSAKQSTQNWGQIVRGPLQSHTFTLCLPTYKILSHPISTSVPSAPREAGSIRSCHFPERQLRFRGGELAKAA